MKSTLRIRWLRAATASLGLISLCTSTFAATSLSQFGITWTFDRDYATGRFANGDHWVVGPVTITDISPRSITTSDGSTLHGTMANPGLNGAQGYDSRIRNHTYRASLNVGLQLPLIVPAGTSLLSAESLGEVAAGNDPQLKTVAILTVLATPAAEGSFRPPVAGSDKTPRWNRNQLDRSKLRSLPRVASAPDLAVVERWFERPWIEQSLNWTGRQLHPRDNQPDYGRELAHQLAAGLLSLQLDYTPEQKETLLIRLVQYGLDVYGVARAGGRWNADGGHNQGRKLPLLLAGTLLHDPAILAYGDARRHFIFQEDQQTWYVQPEDVGRTLYSADGRPREPYLAVDVGIAEWGEKHVSDPKRDGRNWNAYYRNVSGAPTMGHVLAARLMGLEAAWNWPALFDYATRYWQQEKDVPTNGPNTLTGFVKALWAEHLGDSASSPATLPPPAASARARLANISTRGRAGTGDAAMIAGFVIRGDQPRPVLIRAIGPSLSKFGVSRALADSRLVVFRGQSRVAECDNWGGHSAADTIAATSRQVGAFELAADSRDAAVVMSLAPGAYTAQLSGGASGDGVGLIEVYDAGVASSERALVNLSTRGHVGIGDEFLIAGIVVAEGDQKRVLVRAIGPGLSAFGVTGRLDDPQLRIVQNGQPIAENDNWAGQAEVAAAAAAAGAFALPAESRDACLLLTLSPGSYTAQVSGRAGATGTALVEVYEVP